MERSTKVAGSLAAVVAFSLTMLGPSAMADSTQTSKNNARNAAIAGGAVTLYGLKNHQNTTTLLGAAGTAYALSQYERKRHEQSVRRSARRAYRKHHHAH